MIEGKRHPHQKVGMPRLIQEPNPLKGRPKNRTTGFKIMENSRAHPFIEKPNSPRRKGYGSSGIPRGTGNNPEAPRIYTNDDEVCDDPIIDYITRYLRFGVST
jgi:hypothetical protein